MDPEIFQLNVAPLAVFAEQLQLPALAKALGKIREQVRHNFAAASLWLHNFRDGYKLAGFISHARSIFLNDLKLKSLAQLHARRA
jgi:hypothetical protein